MSGANQNAEIDRLREEKERMSECDHPFLADFDNAADCIAAGKCVCGKDRGEIIPAFASAEDELLHIAEYLGCDPDSYSIVEVIGDKVRENERLKAGLAEQAKMMAVQFEAYMEQKDRATTAEVRLKQAVEALKRASSFIGRYTQGAGTEVIRQEIEAALAAIKENSQ